MSLYGLIDDLFPGGLTDDLFGEGQIGQGRQTDATNKHLFLTMSRDYVKWHETNHHFYEGYDSDKGKLRWLHRAQWGWALFGLCFMGLLINPNYTSSRSWYLRKLNAGLGAYVGFAWGKKKKDDQMSLMLLQMWDYFPQEVRRAFESKDYRHLALFDWENPGRQLFHPDSGKSL